MNPNAISEQEDDLNNFSHEPILLFREGEQLLSETMYCPLKQIHIIQSSLIFGNCVILQRRL